MSELSDSCLFIAIYLNYIYLIYLWTFILGLVSFGGTDRDDISMQFASRDFRPSWEAVKLPLVTNPFILYLLLTFLLFLIYIQYTYYW